MEIYGSKSKKEPPNKQNTKSTNWVRRPRKGTETSVVTVVRYSKGNGQVITEFLVQA